MDGCAIVFKKPEMAFYYDIEELKAAREAAKFAKTGQIQGFFRQVHITQEKVAYGGPKFANEEEKEKTKPKAKAGLDGTISGMGVGAGRQLYPKEGASSDGPAGQLYKLVTIKVRLSGQFYNSTPLHPFSPHFFVRTSAPSCCTLCRRR